MGIRERLLGHSIYRISHIRKVHKIPKGLWGRYGIQHRGELVHHARCIGPYLSDNMGCTWEVQLGLQSFKAAWRSMKGFRTSSTSLRWRINIFKGYCLGTALSAVETLVGRNSPLRPSDVQPLENHIVKYGRVLFKGTAWDDEVAGHVKSLENT